ncbi:MAG: hypothetical protein KatS3mg126_0930 [Lysobacteraceae bacterium]|nr:MAG: hypothetical protein KatS3mg126_0930 [Xanthomonadaceae bacterium]
MSATRLLSAFLAGLVSTLLFHQGLLALFHAAGVAPVMPWNFRPVPPFGVPAVLSLAFWGGVWAVALDRLLRPRSTRGYWLGWVVAGAIGPSAVALFVVFPLKGLAFAAGWDPRMILGALLLNGVWGLGCALLLRGAGRR